ncbi:hypothetical protein [Alysiella crassa]|uniref:hypothetical protein n=1 Tax=Alysiella crassa TaxID=153491 RepID=UPI0012ECA3AE|nr:hypothetical protein [Alysiella crassa]UOP06380.1 hypothetical protein LVJ80_11425 [Alysiella crassa]
MNALADFQAAFQYTNFSHHKNVGCAVRTKWLNNLNIMVDLVRTAHPTVIFAVY